MPRACAAEPVAVDQVELESHLVAKGRVTRPIWARDRPSAFSKMVINMVP
jgi:hypothetical protein